MAHHGAAQRAWIGGITLLLLLGASQPALGQELGAGVTTWKERWWAPAGVGVHGWVSSSPERPFRIRATLGGQWGGKTEEGTLCEWFEDPGTCRAESVRTRTSVLLGDLTAQMVLPPVLGVRVGLGAGVGVRRIDYRARGLDSGREQTAENADGAFRPSTHWSVHAERRTSGRFRVELGIHRSHIHWQDCPADARCVHSESGLTRVVLGVGFAR
jgi:hypothetical protein